MANIAPSPLGISTDAYREGVRSLVADSKPSLFITLAFNCETTVEAASKKLRDFQARVDHHLLGHRWQKMTGRRTRYIAVIEHPDTNLHIHVALAVSLDRVKHVEAVTDESWKKLVPSGTTDVKLADNPFGLGRYIAKAIGPTTSDRLLISNPV